MNRSIPVGACLIVAAAVICGCKSSEKTPVPGEALNPKELQIRNNAASLLFDLLNDEKNLSKLFFIKAGRPELKELARAISQAAGAGAKQLESLAKADPSLDLQLMALPQGEVLARQTIAKTSKGEILGSSGPDLEFNVLLSQAGALRYGSHLATIAADNSVRKNQIDEFKALSTTLNNLRQQVIAMLRSAAK